MYTISDIMQDIDRGCLSHNMQEDRFSYRIIFYVNENGGGTKHYADTPYDGLRKSLENIIREHLSVTNSVVITAVTVRKNGQSICLQSRSYSFSLDGYFQHLTEGYKDADKNRNIMYGRYAVG